MPQPERIEELNHIARNQLEVMTRNDSIKALKATQKNREEDK
jgi:hypothetical protein